MMENKIKYTYCTIDPTVDNNSLQGIPLYPISSKTVNISLLLSSSTTS